MEQLVKIGLISTSLLFFFMSILFYDKYKTERIEKEKIVEQVKEAQTLREHYEQLVDKYKKENAEQEKKYSDLMSRVNRGNVRVYLPEKSVTITKSSDRKERCQLNPEVVERVLSVGRDGDRAINDLNLCIDSYNKAKEIINGTESSN